MSLEAMRIKVAQWLEIFARIIVLEDHTGPGMMPKSDDSYKGFLDDAQKLLDTVGGQKMYPPSGSERVQ